MTDEMTPERLAEIRARVKATTEGPWSFHPNHAFADPSDPLYVAGDGTVIADDISKKNNAVFIAHSRTDVPALIAEVERLRVIADGMATDDDVTYEQLTAARYQLAKRLAEIKARAKQHRPGRARRAGAVKGRRNLLQSATERATDDGPLA